MKRLSILITGGAGFIGANLARTCLAEGHKVHVFDNLSRAGVDANVRELEGDFPGLMRFTRADVRDANAVERAVEEADQIFHLAAQVAVTTSLEDPIDDAGTNLFGTLNLLEAVRHSGSRPALLFTSTNKVYGRLKWVALNQTPTRYEPADQSTREHGACENQPLEFLSPYGCSKGSADQYVLDYARSYGVRATVFRMSCIYGPYQLGSEDQGWVAHFLRQAMKGEAITIYGDGKQVRDLLFIEDLVRAMRLAIEHPASSAEAFNLGGGVENSVSLIELIKELQLLTRDKIEIEWREERAADQKWYIADTSKIRDRLEWAPQVSVRKGLGRLHEWYLARPSLIAASEAQVA
ncbi:MAG: SDR family NAD(P)-dependent oxidoreductase [Acidobacteriaceae bacterium]|nr:SDR family NAD(P)-dependent oxidoreductase [Acidobacteriaceae bacterium]